MKKLFLFCLVSMLFNYHSPSYAAAIYDVSGVWAVQVNGGLYYQDGSLAIPIAFSTSFALQQNSQAPNDYFEVPPIDGMFPLTIYGHVFNDSYVIDGPSTGLPSFVPQDNRPYYFTPGALGDTTPVFFHHLFDKLEVTVSDGGNACSGVIEMTWTGWYRLQSDPSQFFHDSSMEGMKVMGTITGTHVPIPSAVWLLGSGLIGLVGFRKKFRKEGE